jgi:hypothetical protein
MSFVSFYKEAIFLSNLFNTGSYFISFNDSSFLKLLAISVADTCYCYLTISGCFISNGDALSGI